jgi:hypothetical protein
MQCLRFGFKVDWCHIANRCGKVLTRETSLRITNRDDVVMMNARRRGPFGQVFQKGWIRFRTDVKSVSLHCILLM